MERKEKYPIGEQDFKSLIEGGFLYVDKTRFIEKILVGNKYYFLGRPRRFGKSLFLSSLRYFFEGKRELFKNLYIDKAVDSWEPHPVLYLDLNREKYQETEKLNDVLLPLFREWEERYDVDVKDTNLPQRFQTIIKAAHEKTGKQVVILVDEYDKPLVNSLNNEERFETYRSQLASLYSNFKSSAEHIRLVFLTGVSRFSKLSIFSDLNNLKDISLDNRYAAICGITNQELLKYFPQGIKRFAAKENCGEEEIIQRLKENYDGYRFSAGGSDIFNPWSLLNAMDNEEIENFWNDTGYPSIIAEALKRIDADLEKYFDTICSYDELKGFDILSVEPLALLYQTGYLTIKDYDAESRTFQLGIPNKEVKTGLFNVLLPYYVKTRRQPANKLVTEISSGFIMGRPDRAMEAMQAYFAGIDYTLRIENENNFHNAFFLLMDMLGLNTVTESHTSQGRIDMEVKTRRFLYIIELKYDHSAEYALSQIEEKNYARKYQIDNRKKILIGVAFSSKTRCIEEWKIKEIK